jgi:galactose oxidase-like protein
VLLVWVAGLLVGAAPQQAIGSWASIGAAPVNPLGMRAVALPDGRTLFVGGVNDGTATNAVIVFNPSDSSFAPAGQLLEPRTGHTATLLDDGRVLVAGGTVNDLLSADLEIFDLATGTSTVVGPIAQHATVMARHGCTTAQC